MVPISYECPECDELMEDDEMLRQIDYAYFWCPRCLYAMEFTVEGDRVYGQEIFI